MRSRLILAWLALCGMLVFCVACEEAATLSPTACDFSAQTAVFVDLTDASGASLDRVEVRYRLDDAPWQSLPEKVNGRALIPGPAGMYQIHAEKPAYASNEITVIVPTPAGCQMETQTVSLSLDTAVCPIDPPPVTLSLQTPAAAEVLRVTAVSPDGRQELACYGEGDLCQTFDLPLGKPGDYRLDIDRLPALGAMYVTDDVVDYALEPYRLLLTHQMQRQTVEGEGATEVQLTFPVTLDEVGCPLPDLRALTTITTPDKQGTDPFPSVSISQQGMLLMTDLGAPDCQEIPRTTPVVYDVMLPIGTQLSQTTVQYWLEEQWQVTPCELANGRYQCTAQFPNPLLRQPYIIKAVINGVDYVDTQLPFDNLCIVFR